jgi:hypothetical protein
MPTAAPRQPLLAQQERARAQNVQPQHPHGRQSWPTRCTLISASVKGRSASSMNTLIVSYNP